VRRPRGARDDGLHAGVSPVGEVAEEPGETRLVLRVAYVHTDALTVPITSQGGRDHHSPGHDPPVIADLEFGRSSRRETSGMPSRRCVRSTVTSSSTRADPRHLQPLHPRPHPRALTRSWTLRVDVPDVLVV
jgi:hypothetical protein